VAIRIKPFSEELRERSLRTLDIFLTALVERAGRLPDNFFVTLPKVSIAEQVAVLADVFDRLEPALRLPPGSLRMELMVETPQAIRRRRPRAAAAAGGSGAGPLRRRALRHLRLHRQLSHHRRAPGHGPPGMRFRPPGNAGGAEVGSSAWLGDRGLAR
jgi:hypothetical protein